MRQQIQQAIRNAGIPLNNMTVDILLDTNLEDLLAIETDKGLDPQGTIVHWYNHFTWINELHNVSDLGSEDWIMYTEANRQLLKHQINEEIARLQTNKMTFENVGYLYSYLYQNHDIQTYGFREAFEEAVIRHQNTDLDTFEFEWITYDQEKITLEVKINEDFTYEMEVK